MKTQPKKPAAAKTKFVTIRLTEQDKQNFDSKCSDKSNFLRSIIKNYDEVNSFLNTLEA